MIDTKVKIFFSYSHKDESLCLELQKHLGPLKRADIISNWLDREIKPGMEWDSSIKNAIKNSDIILFLISPDFLSSEYIYENEIKQAITQHNNGESIVVPIMLRKCDIEFTPFKQIQGLPTDFEPITSKRWYTIDDAFFDVIEGLKKVIQKTKERKLVLVEEEDKWKKAEQTNTIASYISYLESSKLKTKLDFAIARISDLNALGMNNVSNLPNNDKVELELLERERRKIAFELHDNVGSVLSFIKLTLHSLNLDNEKYERCRQGLDEVLSTIRRISRSLSLNLSENEFDLKESILDLQGWIIKTNKVEFELELNNIEEIKKPQLEINIFRILQELLNNVLQHSSATKVQVTVSKAADLVLLQVTDNGIGFNIGSKRLGIGLNNIKSRVQYYNGTEEIISSDNGTSFKITIPITI